MYQNNGEYCKEKITNKTSVLRHSGVISSFAVLQIFLSYGKEVVIAYHFGASKQLDAYLVAYSVIGLFATVMKDPLEIVFVPIFAKYKLTVSNEEAWKCALSLACVLILVLLFMVLIGEWFAIQIVNVMAPGFSPETVKLTTRILRIILPAVIFLILTLLMTGILNFHRHFAIPALAPLALNSTVICFILFFQPTIGVVSMAYGLLLGYFVGLVIQFPKIVKTANLHSFSIKINHQGIGETAKLAGPIVGGLVFSQVSVIVERILASRLGEGTISALSYAKTIAGLPTMLFSFAFAKAIFPSITECAVKGDINELKTNLSFGIRAITLLMMPIMVGLFVMRVPIIRLLFQRGAFTSEVTHTTSIALMYLSLGIYAQSINLLLTRTFIALSNTQIIFKMIVTTTMFHIIGNIILVRIMGIGGLALICSLDSLIAAPAFGFLLRKKIGALGDELRNIILFFKVVFSSIAMGIWCYISIDRLRIIQYTDNLAGKFGQAGVYISITIIGALIYLIMLIILRVKEINIIWRITKDVFKRFKQVE